MRGPAVVKVVAVDRGDNHMRQSELKSRLGDVLRLGRIEGARKRGLDVAERASAGAGIAHDHEGGVLFLPAFADVRAGRLLANGVESVGAHDVSRLDIAARNRRLDPDPIGLASARLVRPMNFLRMARL